MNRYKKDRIIGMLIDLWLYIGMIAAMALVIYLEVK